MADEFETLIYGSPDPVAILDLEGKIKAVNRAFSNILGWNNSELIAKNFWEIVVLDQQINRENIYRSLSQGRPVFFINTQIKCKNGQWHSFRWTAYPDRKAETITSVLRDSHIYEVYETVILAAEASPTGILVVSDGVIRYANWFIEMVFGYSSSELIGKPVEILIPSHLQTIHQAHRKRYEQEPYLRQMGTTHNLIGRNKDGREFPVDVGLSPVHTANGLSVVCSIIDMTKRKESDEDVVKKIQNLEFKVTRLDKLSKTDALTQIRNRREMDAQLELQYRDAQNKGEPLSFILLDIDDFKRYNDSFGHLAGDEVLKFIAKILKLNLRRSEIIARYGGEEFAVILPGDNLSDAMNTAERIRKTIEEFECPFQRITVSLGCTTIYPKIGEKSEPEDANKLIRMADQALYYSKRTGKNRVTHFDQLGLNPEEKLPDWKFRFDMPNDHET